MLSSYRNKHLRTVSLKMQVIMYNILKISDEVKVGRIGIKLEQA